MGFQHQMLPPRPGQAVESHYFGQIVIHRANQNALAGGAQMSLPIVLVKKFITYYLLQQQMANYRAAFG